MRSLTFWLSPVVLPNPQISPQLSTVLSFKYQQWAGENCGICSGGAFGHNNKIREHIIKRDQWKYLKLKAIHRIHFPQVRVILKHVPLPWFFITWLADPKMDSLYYYSNIWSCHSRRQKTFDRTKCFCPGQGNGAQLALEPRDAAFELAFLRPSSFPHSSHLIFRTVTCTYTVGHFSDGRLLSLQPGRMQTWRGAALLQRTM